MKTRETGKSSYLLFGIGLAAVGGLIAALFARKETRESLRERSGKSLDYLNQRVRKLRDSADVLLQQGKKLINCQRRGSADADSEAEKQAYQEDRRDNLGG